MITAGQGDDYTTGCLRDYPYFKNDYKMITTDLSKQQALDANPKAIQQITFTGNLNRRGGATLLFKINHFKFFAGNSESIIILFCFNIISI